MVSLGERQLREGAGMKDIQLIRCPAHLLHDVVKWLCRNSTSPDEKTLHREVTFLDAAVETSRLRGLVSADIRLPRWAETRWCTLHRSLELLLEVCTSLPDVGLQFQRWDVIMTAVGVTKITGRSSLAQVESTIKRTDPRIRIRLYLTNYLLAIFSRHIKWFESTGCVAPLVLEQFTKIEHDLSIPITAPGLNATAEELEWINLIRASSLVKWRQISSDNFDSATQPLWELLQLLNPSRKSTRAQEDNVYLQQLSQFSSRVPNIDRSRVREELCTYLAQPFNRQLTGAQVWDYWRDSQNRFPNLAPLALALLCIPISSAEAERSLKDLKELQMNPKRTNLTREHASWLAFMYYNRHTS